MLCSPFLPFQGCPGPGKRRALVCTEMAWGHPEAPGGDGWLRSVTSNIYCLSILYSQIFPSHADAKFIAPEETSERGDAHRDLRLWGWEMEKRRGRRGWADFLQVGRKDGTARPWHCAQLTWHFAESSERCRIGMSQEKLVVLLHRGLGPGWGLSFVPQPTHVPPLCPLAGSNPGTDCGQ